MRLGVKDIDYILKSQCPRSVLAGHLSSVLLQMETKYLETFIITSFLLKNKIQYLAFCLFLSHYSLFRCVDIISTIFSINQLISTFPTASFPFHSCVYSKWPFSSQQNNIPLHRSTAGVWIARVSLLIGIADVYREQKHTGAIRLNRVL